jgi:carbamoyl-phosphate synthase large subunit
MEIVYNDAELDEYMTHAVDASPERPILIDKFLEDAIEVDVDAVADGEQVVVAAVMEHIEQAGVHSGDSVCTIPPFTLSDSLTGRIRRHTYALGKELRVKGLMNIQYAVKGETVYVLEVNPRASRTVPFCSKATGMPWAKIASKVMAGKKLSELGITREMEPDYFSVKEPVFPFSKFAGIDIILGPEMRSTGEVMGIDPDLGTAFAKGRMASNNRLPSGGKIFISVNDADKRSIILVARKLTDLGFEIICTTGTYKVLERNGVPAVHLRKIQEGVRPNIIDLIKNGVVNLVINTPSGKRFRRDEIKIRQMTVLHNIPCITTLAGALTAVNGLESLATRDYGVKPLQDYHADCDNSEQTQAVEA